MTYISSKLRVDPESECRHIEQLIESKLVDLGRSGIIVGISGGLDSAIAAYLSVRSVGKDKVSAAYIPDRDSKRVHRQHAEQIARELGIQLETIDLTPILSTLGVYDLLPLHYIPSRGLRSLAMRFGKNIAEAGGSKDILHQRFQSKPNSLMAKANAYVSIKHRARMILLYYQSEVRNLMVVGASNKTEFLTGTFIKWGCDHCADVMPIIHLYRSQLCLIAEYLQIPEEIRKKSADPDVLPGLDDKEQLLGSFSETDQILWGLENDCSPEELIEAFGENVYIRTRSLWEASRHMRQSPYLVD
jgi:NAD+ synthase